MKRSLLYLLLFVSICCRAQNYQCLQAGVTRYFINDNGYVRAMRLDSVNTYADSTIYFPYRTPRGAYGFQYEWDTALRAGGCWLGKQVTALNDGTFLFDNYWSASTLVIKTLANPLDSWVMYKDTGSLYYKAVMLNVDTMTVLGALDSVKNILVRAINASGPVTSDPLDSFQITLSKDHGVIQAFDLYMFPYHEPDSAYKWGKDFFTDRILLPADRINSPFPERKSPVQDKTNSLFHLVDLIDPNDKRLHEWAKGDLFEHARDYLLYEPYWDNTLVVDTIVDKTVSARDVTYTISEQVSSSEGYTTYRYDTTFSDAFHRIIPASFLPESAADKENYIFYFPGDTTYCMNSPLYIASPAKLGSDGEGAFIQSATYKLGIGRVWASYVAGRNTVDALLYRQSDISCGAFKPLKDILVNQLNLQLYPNPATNTLNLFATATIKDVRLYNAVGQTVFARAYNDHRTVIDIEQFPAGLYFVRVNGTDIRKVVKL